VIFGYNYYVLNITILNDHDRPGAVWLLFAWNNNDVTTFTACTCTLHVNFGYCMPTCILKKLHKMM